MFVRKDLNLGKIFSVAIRNCAIQTATTVSIAKELSNACDRMLPHTNTIIFCLLRLLIYIAMWLTQIVTLFY